MMKHYMKTKYFSSFLIFCKVFLSAIFQNNRLGCAYYDTKSCVLYLTEIHEDSNWSLLQLGAFKMRSFDEKKKPHQRHIVKLEANPTHILTSSKADGSFLEALRQPRTILLAFLLLIHRSR